MKKLNTMVIAIILLFAVCVNTALAETTTDTTTTTTTPIGTDFVITSQLPALMLDSTDSNGQALPAPSGNAGDKIKIVLPLKNRGAFEIRLDTHQYVTNCEIMPQISTNLTEFPFVIEELDYKRKLPSMAPGAKMDVEYEFTISPKATAGVKSITFNAVYYFGNTAQTTSFTVFVTVIKGYGGSGSDVASSTSMPKVIIKSYSFEPETLAAGEKFKLVMELHNTSSTQDINNFQLSLKNEEGMILPAPSASNSAYIDSIRHGESETVTFELQSIPDTTEKSHALTITGDYEAKDGDQLRNYDFNESVSIPVSQPLRLRIEDPVIFEDMLMVDQPVSAYMNVYNMGKSNIRNAMIEVAGDGLKLEETVFIGNISAGSSSRADFNIVPTMAGELSGEIVFSYENTAGEAFEKRMPVTLSVPEDMPPEDIGFIEDMEPMPEEPAGIPAWVWFAAGGVVLVIVVIVVVKSVRKKRKHELEAD